MDFPVKSETFVLRDIKSLKEQGEEVSVFTLMGSMERRSHEGIDINRKLKPFGLIIKRALSLIELMFWVRFVLFSEKRFIEKFKLLYLLPRCFKIAHAVDEDKYDVVHLYWGHYPSLVGLILKHRSASPFVSLFLGAYDLEKNLQISKLMSLKADVRWTHAKGNLVKLARAEFPLSDQFILNYRSLKIPANCEQQIPHKFRKYDFITVSRTHRREGNYGSSSCY